MAGAIVQPLVGGVGQGVASGQAVLVAVEKKRRLNRAAAAGQPLPGRCTDNRRRIPSNGPLGGGQRLSIEA